MSRSLPRLSAGMASSVVDELGPRSSFQRRAKDRKTSSRLVGAEGAWPAVAVVMVFFRVTDLI